MCTAASPAQMHAKAYGLSGAPESRSAELIHDLVSLLLTRGPYSWLA